MLVFLVVLFRTSSVKLFTLHSPMCSISIGAALLFFFSMAAATSAAQSTASPPSDAATRANALYQQGLSVLKKDRKSTRLNSSHLVISYAVFCLKKKND